LLRCDSVDDHNIAPVDVEQDEIECCSPDYGAAMNHNQSAPNDESRIPLKLRDGGPMPIDGRFSHTLGSAAIEKMESTQGR